MEPREALVALNLIEGVGPVRVRQLLEHFGDAPPARSTVEVARLPRDVRVEIEVVALVS